MAYILKSQNTFCLESAVVMLSGSIWTNLLTTVTEYALMSNTKTLTQGLKTMSKTQTFKTKTLKTQVTTSRDEVSKSLKNHNPAK